MASYTYSGAGGGDWSAPGNWTPGTSAAGPAAGDDATLPSGTSAAYDSGAAGSVARLTLGTATLTLAKSLTVSDTLSLSAGSALDASAAGLTLTLGADGGPHAASGGAVGGAGSPATLKVAAGALLNLTAGGSIDWGLQIDGTLDVSSLTADVKNLHRAVTITVSSTGTLSLGAAAFPSARYFGDSALQAGSYVDNFGVLIVDPGPVSAATPCVNCGFPIRNESGGEVHVMPFAAWEAGSYHPVTATSSKSLYNHGGTVLLGGASASGGTATYLPSGYQQDSSGVLESVGVSANGLSAPSAAPVVVSSGTVRAGCDASGGNVLNFKDSDPTHAAAVSLSGCTVRVGVTYGASDVVLNAGLACAGQCSLSSVALAVAEFGAPVASSWVTFLTATQVNGLAPAAPAGYGCQKAPAVNPTSLQLKKS